MYCAVLIFFMFCLLYRFLFLFSVILGFTCWVFCFGVLSVLLCFVLCVVCCILLYVGICVFFFAYFCFYYVLVGTPKDNIFLFLVSINMVGIVFVNHCLP